MDQRSVWICMMSLVAAAGCGGMEPSDAGIASQKDETGETPSANAAQLSGDDTLRQYEDPNRMLGDGVITNTRNRGARPQHWEPGWEFRQSLHVYSMHAFRTGWDHSGSITFTYRRPAGSGAAWELYRRTLTCNHGTCPELDPQMKLRYICDPQVVISGWWGEDGECSGDWGPYGWNHRHLCNDDLALQINNAFGRWTGDHCANKGRGITPRCQPHWG